MLPEVSPGLLGHVVSPEVPSKVMYRAVLLLEVIVSLTQVEQRLGLTARCISGPCGGRGASLLQALHVHKPQRAAETVTAELCRFKGKMVRTKSIRSMMFPCLMVRRPSFQLGSRTFSVRPSFTAYLAFSQMESMFQLPTKRSPSLLYRSSFPARMYKSILLPGTLSHGLSRITETVMFGCTSRDRSICEGVDIGIYLLLTGKCI